VDACNLLASGRKGEVAKDGWPPGGQKREGRWCAVGARVTL
jgi:hypothetical protein